MSQKLLALIALISVTASTATQAIELDLAGRLGAYYNMISLNALTQSQETMNRVDLLHLGKNSMRERMRLVSQMNHHLFITVPYWFDDEAGNTTLDLISQRKEQLKSEGKKLDFRVLTDWVSPASSGDFWATKQFARVKEVADGNLTEWNPLWRIRPWSGQFTENRMHDKLFVVDGKTLIMGGMNIASEYLHGGVTRKGWHDTDLMIEGPAAQQGQKLFLKPYLLQNMLDDGADFNYDERFQLAALRNFFYFDKFKFDLPVDGAFRAYFRNHFDMPIEQFLNDPSYFPAMPWKNTYTKPVRLIWDEPLVDRQPVTHAHISKLFDTLDFILPQVKQSMKIFLPYPTFSERMMQFLLKARKQGLKVQIITNSLISHDLGKTPYIAGLWNYQKMLDAGIEINEWQGHSRLEAFERDHGCQIDDYWPGNTLHTKAIVLDDSVAFVGSHNLNVRSELLNSEVMAFVRDTSFAQQMSQIFEYDLDKVAAGQPRTIKCGGVEMEGRPPRTERMTAAIYNKLIKKYKVTSWLFDKLKWAF